MGQPITTDREEVALFAGWCIGSAMGDHHPSVPRERRKVLNDDHVMSVWQDRMARYEADRRKNLLGGTVCAEPVDDDIPF